MTKVLYICIVSSLLMSCASTSHIGTGDRILHRNTFKLNTDDKKINKSKLLTSLKDLVKQQPVKKGLNPRSWGKPLTIYDASLTDESVTLFTQLLRNRKGFYHAQIRYREKVKGRKIEVIYELDLGPRYYISDIEYTSPDTSLLQVVHAHEQNKQIEIGQPLDVSNFDKEKARLVNLLKDNGYAEFSGNFIEFRGDSTDQNVDVKVHFYTPLERETHQKYQVGDIKIFTEHIASERPYHSKHVKVDSFDFYGRSEEFVVNPKSIASVITLQEGSLFNKSIEARTNVNLNRMSPYRYVALDPYLQNDSTYGYRIFLTPVDNKWVFDMGANLFYSTLSQISDQNLIGFSGNVGLENRNFRNNAISHRFGVEGTFEFKLNNITKGNINSLSLQLYNTFEIPRVVDIFGLTRVLNDFGLLTDKAYSNINQNGHTKIDGSLGLTNILDFYSLNNFTASWSYVLRPNPRLRYTLRQIGIDVLYTSIDSIFQSKVLDDNLLLAKSFQDYIFSGFLFREFSVGYQTRETLGGSHFSFLGSLEISGLENLIINKIINWTTRYDDRWHLGDLNFVEFLRLNADVRFYQNVKSRASFAARFNMSIAVPFGDDIQIPFVKQYYVGGPNSIRGWQLRELGPGSYINLITDQSFFQSGDFKLEFNAEYRFDLFWLLEGAVFLDGGNTWLLRKDGSRPGAELSSNFLDEIALSIGWGARLDFDYFIFRFDFGYKLRNPYADPETGSHFVLTNKKYNGALGNINFAINYPF